MQRKPRHGFVLGIALLALIVWCAASLAAGDAKPPIRITVDLRDAPRRIFHARLEIPAAPGPLTLVYPKWLPGEHEPSGPIADLAGVKFTAGGKPLAWRRDDVDMYAFHCEVPAAAHSVEVELDYLSPSGAGSFSTSPAATAQLAVLSWNTLLLYPQGSKSDELIYSAALRLPAGWKFGSALEIAKQSAAEIEFQPVSLTTLIDSPVITGAHFRAIPLTPGETPAHQIDLAGDSAAAVAMSSGLAAQYKQLVADTGALFGARHYRHYDFLLSLSDYIHAFGLEHHQSSDDRVPERTLLDPDLRYIHGGLLPHEFVHSWNGKYRRPAGLATSDFQQPMRGELLWVYEGLTQYLGSVLAARSGLWTPEQYRENLAWVAGYLDRRPGRTWRPLADTAVAAQLLYGARQEWEAWRRGVDFYEESELIWLEADVIIRRESKGRRSLDDFCRRFFGGQSGPPAVVTYTFEDVVTTMNGVTPYDWKGFFRARLDSTSPRAPLGGIEASGWRLVYDENPNEHLRATEETSKITDAQFSLGLILKHDEASRDDGVIEDVIPGTPAALAGIAPGMKLVAVNGRRWRPEVLREALRAAKGSNEPIELLIENAEYFKTYRLDYHDGERYPHLARDRAWPDLLEDILRSRTSARGEEKPK
jgi:predicted metalloprotease with PDZ domain